MTYVIFGMGLKSLRTLWVADFGHIVKAPVGGGQIWPRQAKCSLIPGLGDEIRGFVGFSGNGSRSGRAFHRFPKVGVWPPIFATADQKDIGSIECYRGHPPGILWHWHRVRGGPVRGPNQP